MKQVRLNTFETNSSSTHSLVICIAEEMEAWRSGKLYYTGDAWSKVNVKRPLDSRENIIKALEACGEITADTDPEDIDDIIYDNSIYMYSSWGDNYEHDSGEYVTPNGEKVAWEAYYGYDG